MNIHINEKRLIFFSLFLVIILLMKGCTIENEIEKPMANMTYKSIEDGFIKTQTIREHDISNEKSREYYIKNATKANFSEEIPENVRRMEEKTFELINQERGRFGLKPLKWNDELAYVARKHSEYLASLNKGFKVNIYISHEGEEGEYHDTRLNNAGIYYFSSSAENIFGISIVKSYYKLNKSPAEYYDEMELPEKAVEEWMLSKGHRENILNPEFDESGIGIAIDETGTNYIFTQIFITRAECGYRYGKCCEKKGYYPYCFIPLKCLDNECIEDEDIIWINESN